MTQNDNNEALMGSTLNKAMLADAIAEEFSIDRVQAKTYVESFFRILVEQLAQGGSIKLAGLGKFCVREKNARPGRNMQTGEQMMIAARRVVLFRPSGTLNARVTENLMNRRAAEVEGAAAAE